MKLLHWNVQWCRGIDGTVDPARIARVALGLCDVDIACLQEIAINFPALEGGAGEDQAALLASQFGGYAAAFAAGVDLPDDAGGRRRFGNLIVSRYPLRQIYRHSLPQPAAAGLPSMPRVALEVVVAAPHGLTRILTTHLEYYARVQRAAQVERLRELHAEACAQARALPPSRDDRGRPFEALPRPESAILTGDFNLRPEDPLHARVLAAFDDGTPRFVDAWERAHPGAPHAPTFCVHDAAHSDTPYCCDYVFVTEDLAPRLRAVRVDGVTRASDHQPVIVELE